MPAAKRYRIADEAWLEFEAAADWYLARSPRASARFSQAVLSALEAISESPLRWPAYLHGTRRYLLHRFPFAIIYLDEPQQLDIVAIAHTSRMPGYWKRRL
jgi:toxin ParE1/3/4